MLKENEIVPKIADIMKGMFNSNGIAKITEAETIYKERLRRRHSLPNVSESYLPDLFINLKTRNNKRYQLIFEVKSTGQPRMARMACNFLQEITGNKPNVYGVFAAPYISNESQQICKVANIGFMDLAGNCFLKFGDIFISVEGKKNPHPTAWSLKSLFSPKSSRALRVLLSNPKRKWLTIELAREAEISLGLASNVRRFLLENELISEARDNKLIRFKLSNPEKLLAKWGTEYSYRMNKLFEYYSMENIKQLEQKLPEFLSKSNVKYAFSLTSGASFIAPHLRYVRSFIYIEKGKVGETAGLLKLKPVTSGPNVILMEPYDEGVFYGIQKIRGAKIVSDIQLYLDLINYRERGEEAAEFILEQRIGNKW